MTLNDIVKFDYVAGNYSTNLISLDTAASLAENMLFNLGDVLYLMI